MRIGTTTIKVIAAVALGISLHVSANADAKSTAYEGGYIMAAFGSCPVVAIFGSMSRFIKYQGSKDYNRGFAAFEAAFKKGPRPSKLCFDAARESGFFSVR
ncbi:MULTISPECIES: hypothetical protein [unclassified Mesorhizobium]|uniref:hypothetical protein n=1 Tax=unclassified Mesorhizobium TaxID=325217 RepID=UPI0011270B0A|nr:MULTISPECIES: hypothetical protein [unclassified Mesorhizobium]TPI77688.1 hypothetical protein FJ423_18230 [Mesorhizobium sp. B2-8-9]TPJ30839.1 hypothetical protein FJ425_03675 [Mesorhizobium sp. B2-7-2]